MRTHFTRFTTIVALAAALVGGSRLWAHPAKGSLAPPLGPLKLLQAPPGATASWASLKGKVVIIEFWATWCSPCIASLPHLNELVGALDPTKFQFISIDDEDLNAVGRFLARKKMSGWIGVDETGSVFQRYGITSRPTTVIVDPMGRIAAVTEIDAVTASDLRAVAAGKAVAFKPVMEITTSSEPSTPETSRTLFAVSISKAAPDAAFSIVNHPPTGTDYLGCDADALFTTAFDVFEGRYALKGTMPDGRFDLHTHFVDLPQAVTDADVQQAVLAALHLDLQEKTLTKPAYILRALDTSAKLLSPSASTRKVKRGAWHGSVILMNGTMDDLAYELATALDSPIINETGIAGNYDARFKLPVENTEDLDLDGINAVLKSALGLELIPGKTEMPITVKEVKNTEMPDGAAQR